MGAMRIRELFLASMLVTTFGCPGDDSGEEGGTTVDPTASTTSNGSTSNGSTSDASATDDDSTGGGSTTDAPTGDDTTTADPTTTTDPTTTEGSSSGGGASQACVDFCSAFIATCANFDDYGGMDGCLNSCEMFDQTQLDCRIEHLGYAEDGMVDPHCGHANRDGGGVC